MKFDIDTLLKYADETFICYEKHPNADMYIFGYLTGTSKPTVWNDYTKHCRGLIINKEGEVLEHPFVKFWTFRQYLSKSTVLLNENRVMKVPKGKFRILEKVDGTMCTMYWIGDKPYLATQRSFTNLKAQEATKILYEKYTHTFSKLDRRYTYLFEAVYPESKVLIDYGDSRLLYLIGKIDKQTGLPCELEDIGFPLPKDYTKEYGSYTDFNDLVGLNLSNQEGFVIYFSDGQMLKLKFPWYQKAHSLLDAIIRSDRVIYRKQRELRDLMNLEKLIISNYDIWYAFSIGDYHLDSVISKAPSYFYTLGFESWLNKISESILCGDNPEAIDNWNARKPKDIDVFDMDERDANPHIYESMVINWIKRYIR